MLVEAVVEQIQRHRQFSCRVTTPAHPDQTVELAVRNP